MLKYWKHLAAAFVACLVLVLLTQPAEAAGGQQGAFTYELKGNGTAVITKFDWSKHSGGDVYVPRSIDGYQVTEIGTMAFTCLNPGAELQACENKLGNRPHGQSVAIILPDTITVIADKAFFWTYITSCDIPASVQLIGAGAFAGCPNIRQFSVNSRNTTFAVIDGVLFNKTKKELVAFPLSYPKEQYSIPNGILSIGAYAFYTLNRHESYYDVSTVAITFPDTLTTVGDYAFYGATMRNSGRSIGCDSSIKYVGNYAFAYVNGVGNLAPLTIGTHAFAHSLLNQSLDLSNLTELGEYAFWDCHTQRREIEGFENATITTIPSYAFYESSVYPLQIPDTVTTIGQYAFANLNTNSKYRDDDLVLTIPASVVTIENHAFAVSSGAIAFSDGSHLTSIGDNAFYNFQFQSAQELVLPPTVTSIGTQAFYYDGIYDGKYSNNSLTMLTVPENVTNIGANVVNRTKTVLQVTAGSYADIWASENGFPMQVDDTSWLFE